MRAAATHHKHAALFPFPPLLRFPLPFLHTHVRARILFLLSFSCVFGFPPFLCSGFEHENECTRFRASNTTNEKGHTTATQTCLALLLVGCWNACKQFRNHILALCSIAGACAAPLLLQCCLQDLLQAFHSICHPIQTRCVQDVSHQALKCTCMWQRVG